MIDNRLLKTKVNKTKYNYKFTKKIVRLGRRKIIEIENKIKLE